MSFRRWSAVKSSATCTTSSCTSKCARTTRICSTCVDPKWVRGSSPPDAHRNQHLAAGTVEESPEPKYQANVPKTRAAMVRYMSNQVQEPRKNRPSGCLIVIIAIIVIAGVMIMIESSKTPCQKYDEAQRSAQESTGDLRSYYTLEMVNSGCAH